MSAWWTWIETTAAARAVAQSSTLTAILSASHLLGFTLVMGGALVGNLRLLGWVFARLPASDVFRPTTRGMLLGLAISAATGALLFSARAVEVAANPTFRLKMTLLLGATAFHFAVTRRFAAGAATPPRAVAAVGLLLWAALAVTACAFILLE